MNLQLSDLFKSRGYDFSFEERLADQEKLKERLLEFPELKEYYEDVKDFCEQHIASIVYIEYILGQVTKTCAKENIAIT